MDLSCGSCFGMVVSAPLNKPDLNPLDHCACLNLHDVKKRRLAVAFRTITSWANKVNQRIQCKVEKRNRLEASRKKRGFI